MELFLLDIEYGEISYIPQKYIGKWEGESDTIQIDKIMKMWWSDMEIGQQPFSCSPKSIDVYYVHDYNSNIIGEYLILMLPKTIFGTQKLSISCGSSYPSNVKEWIIREPDMSNGFSSCISVLVFYKDKKMPDSFYACDY